MSAEAEILNASVEFYAALNRMLTGDAGSMASVWSHGATVTALHPIGGRQVGWDAVRESFEGVARIASGGKITMKDQLVQVAGDVAYEVGVEQGTATFGGHQVTLEHRVTNIYQREAGAWKMTHHHTDPSPAMMDVVRRL